MITRFGERQPLASRRNVLIGAGIAASGLAQSAKGQTPQGAERDTATTSPTAFGAIGDGQYHPLSSRFASLAQARAVYPFAERLDQSVDWAGIQAAVDKVEPAGGVVVLPTGRFVLSDPIRLPSLVTLVGEARNGSILDNQNHRIDKPLIVNKDPVAFLYVTIRNLTLHGGTHAIKIRATREVAGIVIEGITTNLQTEANITFSSMQTTVIRDCHLMDGHHGISVEGFPCNSIHIENTRLGRHSDASIRIRGADGFMMIGGSIEAGGLPRKATIDIETGGAYANAVHFQNVYFENTHEFILRSRGAKTVSLRGCKITGTGAGGKPMESYKFDCADDLIVFSDNHWDLPTQGPKNMMLCGSNDNLGGSGNLWGARSARRIQVASRSFSRSEALQGLLSLSTEGEVRGCFELFLEEEGVGPIKRLKTAISVLADKSGPKISLEDKAFPIRQKNVAGRLIISVDEDRLFKGPGTLHFATDLSAFGGGSLDLRVL